MPDQDMKDVTTAYPLRFTTVEEGQQFLKDYENGLTSNGVPHGLPPFKQHNGRAMLNPEYRNAACEIRLLTDGDQGFAACVKLK